MYPRIIRKRQLRDESSRFRNIGFGCSLFVSLFLFFSIVTAVASYIYIFSDLPSLEALITQLDPIDGRLFQPSILYDRTGTNVVLALENPRATEREYLTLDPGQENYFPTTLVQSTLAASDPTYWEHDGYQISLSQENRTLAQQFVFDLLLKNEPPGLRRDLRERLLAAQIINRYGHEKVLEWYLNTVRYGKWIYGADAAARVFFGKPAYQLTTVEATFLAAAAEFPEINPWDTPQIILERQKDILQFMLRQGWITNSDAAMVTKLQLILLPEAAYINIAPSFSQLVLDQLSSQFPNEDLERGGWQIITTLDSDLQYQVECTVTHHLAQFQSGEVLPHSDGEVPCNAAQLLPTLPQGQKKTYDNLDASVVVLDSKRGQILAMVGNASASHPTGPLISPFMYLAAFTRGYSPASLVWDIPDHDIKGEITPDATIYRGPLRVRTAMVNDILQPLKNISSQLGWNVIQATAQQLGLILPGSPVSQDAWLNTETTLVEITNSFSIIGNSGTSYGQHDAESHSELEGTRKLTPSGVIELIDSSQVRWLDWSTPETQAIISPQLAYLVNDILRDESARWLSMGHPNPLEIGRPASAKLGVDPRGNNSWAVGYLPQLAVGVWVGKSGVSSDPLSSSIAASLWHAIIKFASQDLLVENWEPPVGIKIIDVCDPSGLLPTPYCPTIVSEPFLDGNEPTQIDYLYKAYQINRETGRLATVLTPPELVEENIFLVVPPEASTWAQRAGLPTPPDSYDILYTTSQKENVSITSPAMFAHVRGEVRFIGTAEGPQFDFYRLQVGEGLNPQVWQQVGEDSTDPVLGNTLAIWDTKGLRGLYAIQLLVVNKDQRVERTILQVTVDNSAPEVHIISPEHDQEIDSSEQKIIVFQASVQDNLEIGRVEFYIDKRKIASLTEAPYQISWQLVPGEHILLIRGFDLAENASETAVRFLVK